MEVMREIEAACGLQFTHIVNNSNLGTETTPQTVLDSLPFIEELSRISGLPVWLHTVEQRHFDALCGQLPNLLGMKLQEKYFDLPTQRPQNRPLWG